MGSTKPPTCCPECGLMVIEDHPGDGGRWYSCIQHTWFVASPPASDAPVVSENPALYGTTDYSKATAEGSENRFHRAGYERIEGVDRLAPNLRDYLERTGQQL